MSTRDLLNGYIQQLQARLRLGAILRGGAILTSAALSATVLLVLIANAFAFSSWSLTSARVLLLLVLAFAVGFGLAIPLYGLNRRRAAAKAEAAFPQFQQRLTTFAEHDEERRDPFIDLLAADTMEMAREAQPSHLVSDRALLTSLCVGVVSLGVLIWMIVAGPGYLGHGASLLWTGSARSAAPLYDLRVMPGDASVRRNTDQIVTAQLTGVQTKNVRLYARYASASKWEQVTMQPQPAGSGFQFLFAGLPEDVEYYIEAGPLDSKHFKLKVVDLPAVKQIRVTYHFPSWTGLPAAVEEHGGDLRAVEGTKADLEVTMDRPMRDGVLALDDNTQLKLAEGTGNVYKGSVQLDKDGQYHVAALDHGQPVRLSEDYFIEARKANPPDVRLSRPGADYRASPIEEVTIAAQASDEFGLGDVTLHYSVNGGPEKAVSVLKQKGTKQADGSTTLALEDFKLVPGDLVSVYATAKDARAESRTDMMFIQADPFEREFSQSQTAGGGGGGGGGMGGANDQIEISQREKEIIAATWKQQGQKGASKQEISENAKFLSGVQAKLHDQALSLSGRLQARELSDANQDFSDFQKDMSAAAEAMSPAADKLQKQKWTDAIPDEQKALQHLLRAEATFRQIQVAFGARGGGGGGGGAGRDLQSLFDLELDTEKNQYETGQNNASASQKSQEIDDALQKLDQLAKRQEQLAQEQRNQQQTEAERWQQEMLKRQAEELQKQIEQLTRNGQQQNAQQQNGQNGQQGGQQSGQQQGGQQQGGQQGGQQSAQQNGQQRGNSSAQGGASGSGQSGSGGQQPANSESARTQQALDRLKQAQEDMARASSTQEGQAAARRAADRLREATDLLSGLQQQQSTDQLSSMSRAADRLADEQRDQAARERQLFGQKGAGNQPGSSGATSQDQTKLGDERQQMAGELANLEKQMRDAARGLAGTQQAASSKVRDALGQAEQSDLENRIRRSAEWMRRGIDPNSDGTEPAVAAGLQQLSDQLKQAQQAVNNNQQGPEQALNRVEQLRGQMEALARGLGNRNPQEGAQGPLSRQPGQGQPGQNPGQQGQGQSGQAQSGQANGGQAGGGQANGGQQAGGAFGARQFGGGGYGTDGRYDGGYRMGYDPGGYRPQGTERQPAPSSPAEIQRAYEQALHDLNDLRQEVRGQPDQLADLQELIRQMQQLDPSRFPGNPQMLAELHDKVLTTVDKLELRLRRQVDDKQSGQVRSGDNLPVPDGYQDSVAEYFRRLSNSNKQQ